MAKAEKCPVCVGTGKFEGVPCHGCGGKGWVEVGDSYPIPYPLPYPQPYPDYPYPYYPNTDPPYYPNTSGISTPARCPSCGGYPADTPQTGCPRGFHYGVYFYDF